MNRGRLLLKRKQWLKARTDFNKVLQLEPGHATARLLRAWTYLKNNEAQLAEEDYNRLIKEKKELASAHAYRGLAHIHLFKDKEAQQDLAIAGKLVRLEKSPASLAGLKIVHRLVAQARLSSTARQPKNQSGHAQP